MWDSGPFVYDLELPQPLASWDVWDYWERERISSMQATLTTDDVLFDVGAEQGWMSTLFAKYMTPNIVLFEPTAEFWPNIKATFEKNGLQPPLATWMGLVSDRSFDDASSPQKGWPTPAHSGQLIDRNKYVNLHDQGHITPQITIDDFVRVTEVTPTALSIDVEGAEHLVLEGARATLTNGRPYVWVSQHPDLLERDYGVSNEAIFTYMGDLGYARTLLATDHEEHWLYWKLK